MSDTENLRDKFKRPLERPGAGPAAPAKRAEAQLPVPIAQPAPTGDEAAFAAPGRCVLSTDH